MDKNTEPITAEFVRWVEELDNEPKGKSMKELDAPTPPPTKKFEIPPGPMLIGDQWW